MVLMLVVHLAVLAHLLDEPMAKLKDNWLDGN